MMGTPQPGDRVRIVPSEEVPNSGFRGMEGEVLTADDAGPLSWKPDVLVVLDDYFEPVPFWVDELDPISQKPVKKQAKGE